MSIRWAPPLPSLGGRAGSRSLVESNSTYLQRLEIFLQEHSSCSSFFERGVDIKFVRRLESNYGRFVSSPFDEFGRTRPLSAYNADEQYLLLLNTFYFKVSGAFKRRLKACLYKGKLNTVKQWFYTADAIVIPYLLSVDYPDFVVCDKLSKFALESCANNYSHFTSLMKSVKKGIRKSFALSRGFSSERPVRTYCKVLNSIKLDGADPRSFARLVLIWTQTRASGLADGKMIRQSLKKLEATVTRPTPEDPRVLSESILIDSCRGFMKATGTHAKISVGSSSCLEFTKKDGGKTSMLRYICRHKVLSRTFNFQDLSCEYFEPRSCRSSTDVLSWAIDWVLKNPIYARVRRAHAVAENSKARTIAVPPYAVTVMFGVCAHIVAPTLTSQGVRSGLKSSRHLWNFLRDNLNPQNTLWEELHGEEIGPVYSLSTDEETATDFGDLNVSDQVWRIFIHLGKTIEGFPLGLFQLCRTVYGKPRIYLIPERQGYRPVIGKRGWPMGDLFTKIILTVVNDYCLRSVGLKAYSLVGDDIIALSRTVRQLELLLERLEWVGMIISYPDTFISCLFAFYCEEGCIIPQRSSQTPRVQMRRGENLLYIDYPRIRLMIPTQSETDAYSSSNVGRFALLGKESRWISRTNPSCLPYFAKASLIQHMLVPQDKDVICPYLPSEIGGDGAFPHSARFLQSIVRSKKARVDLSEIAYRMDSLLSNKFSHRFVRSERFDAVIHKHHLYLDKVEKLEGLLPPGSVIRPMTEAARVLMNSVNIPYLERPTQTYLRLVREAYYKAIFSGLDPVEPKFDLEKNFGNRNGTKTINVWRFFHTWKDPGFIYHDVDPYFVIKDKIVPVATTGLGWSFRSTDTDSKIFSDWVRNNMSVFDMSMDNLMFYLNGGTLHPRVADRLSNFFESDVYVMSLIDLLDLPDLLVIVTRDIKLGFRAHNYVNSSDRIRRDGQRPCPIICLDPLLYLVGRSDVVGHDGENIKFIEDAGSMIHCDFTEFQEGSPITVTEDELFTGEPVITNSRFTPWVKVIQLPRTG